MSPADHAQEIVSWYSRHYPNQAELCERLRRHAKMLEPLEPEIARRIHRTKLDVVRILSR